MYIAFSFVYEPVVVVFETAASSYVSTLPSFVTVT